MPLSEEELRLLEQMERALVQEDPKLASTLRGTAFRRTARRRAILAGVGFLAGIGILIAGAAARSTVLGVLGFLVMLGCATVAVTALRHQPNPIESRGETSGTNGPFTVIDGGRSGRRSRSSARGGASFMDRLEERWRRRRDERGDG